MNLKVIKYYDFYSFEAENKLYLVKPEHTTYFLDAIICKQHPDCTHEVYERRVEPVLSLFDPTCMRFAYKNETPVRARY